MQYHNNNKLIMKNFKCTVVGDGAVGKTTLLQSFVNNTTTDEYIPTVFDNYRTNLIIDNEPYILDLWDTAGQEDYDKIRTVSYTNTDIVIICFSIISPSSLRNVKAKWLPEIRHYLPNVPILIVGLKQDLRNNVEICKKLLEKNLAPINYEEGKLFARTNNSTYFECSSITQYGVKEIFDNAVREAIKSRIVDKPKKRCVIC